MKEIKVYGQIGREVTAQWFTDELNAARQSGAKGVVIRLHSPGGEVFDGNAMYNAMKQSGLHIKIVVDGMAASMASFLLLAADEVEVPDNALIMIHRPYSYAEGNADAIEGDIKVLRDIENEMIKGYAAKTGLTPEEVKNMWFDGVDHWLNADEAISYHLADRKISQIAKGVAALVTKNMHADSVYKRFSASLNIKSEYNMKKELIDTFDLQGVTEASSDEEVVQALVDKFDALEKQVNASAEAQVDALIDAAVDARKITAMQRSKYKDIGLKMGVSTLTGVLGDIKPYVPIRSQIQGKGTPEASVSGIKARGEWTLDDYRKNAPNELRDNPELYKKLVKAQYGE
ncbi:head maturation protease, ClpP-related [Dysgonomonas termitidis]|uniref:ATP-dependent Clp protease proteolytic subunit n=1 Tax=Dysgonomonas termitidis TaxID=1516126 RepID=A0ABV9KRZ5_9BACT